MGTRIRKTIHPRTGMPLAPVGFRKDGRPIWPILGGSDDGGAGGAGGTGGDGGGTPPGDGGNGSEDVSGLKSALATEREARKAAEREARRAKDLETELEKLRAAGQSEQDKALEAARKEGEKAARAEVTRDRVLDKIEVAAAGKFADLEDARLHLGPRFEDFVGSDGAIDTDAISKAVADLLESKPHLKADQGPDDPGRAGIGVAGGGGKPEIQPGLPRLRHAYETSGKSAR